MSFIGAKAHNFVDPIDQPEYDLIAVIRGLDKDELR